MAEYIDIDKNVIVYDTAGRKREVTVRHILSMNRGEFEVDAVRPVVLCKDCRHRDPEDHKCDCGQLERAGCVFPVDDDYFCADGEKREES